MADERSFMNRWRSLSEKGSGQPMSDEDAEVEFALCGPQKRIAIMDAMDAEPLGEIGTDRTSMIDLSRRERIRRSFDAIHHRQLRIGR